jgi:hypothetical protein
VVWKEASKHLRFAKRLHCWSPDFDRRSNVAVTPRWKATINAWWWWCRCQMVSQNELAFQWWCYLYMLVFNGVWYFVFHIS